jgi:hypothetical protein
MQESKIPDMPVAQQLDEDPKARSYTDSRVTKD